MGKVYRAKTDSSPGGYCRVDSNGFYTDVPITAAEIKRLHALVVADEAKPAPPWEGNIAVESGCRSVHAGEFGMTITNTAGDHFQWSDLGAQPLPVILRALALHKLKETGGVVPKVRDLCGGAKEQPWIEDGVLHTTVLRLYTEERFDLMISTECAVIVHEYEEACRAAR